MLLLWTFCFLRGFAYAIVQLMDVNFWYQFISLWLCILELQI